LPSYKISGGKMNAFYYASLEASKKLVDAGIVLETEFYWHRPLFQDDYELKHVSAIQELLPLGSKVRNTPYPAPSMAEVWRELPEFIESLSMKYKKTMMGKKCGYF